MQDEKTALHKRGHTEIVELLQSGFDQESTSIGMHLDTFMFFVMHAYLSVFFFFYS